jgi:hypothetical protein
VSRDGIGGLSFTGFGLNRSDPGQSDVHFLVRQNVIRDPEGFFDISSLGLLASDPS